MAVAARNLRGDVQHLNLSNSLKFFTASKKQSTGNRSSFQPPKAKPQVQQPVVRLPEGSLTKPQEDEVGGGGGVRSRNIPDFYPPPLLGCRSHPSRPPISKIGKQMGSENPIGGVQPPLLQSASSHFSRLSGLLPESGEEEGPSRCSEGDGDERGDRSRLFLVPKARGTWRPIIDLSVLNTHIQCPSFKMETNGSLLKALQKGQWLTILDLKDAYFHIPIHPSYRQYLLPRFCHEGVVWQFRALPFGLNTAPRVFTMVTAPVVAYAHLNGVSLHVYLDDWLLNPMSEESAKQQTQ